MVFKALYRISFLSLGERVNEKVIGKALWDIFIGVSEASKLTT